MSSGEDDVDHYSLELCIVVKIIGINVTGTAVLRSPQLFHFMLSALNQIGSRIEMSSEMFSL